MSEFLLHNSDRHFIEHHKYPYGEDVTEYFIEQPKPIIFLQNADKKCVEYGTVNDSIFLHTSYYVGVDWVIKYKKAIYVQPKLNENSLQTNYLEMLFSALKHPETSEFTDDLFEVKWDEPQIEITQQQDHLTPLLIVQFLQVVKRIVRKGLKKSYYNVEQNLHSRVKGKILVGRTIKQNLLKNKIIHTYCSFDEFGINNLENRLLKKALIFVQRYMPALNILHSKEYAEKVFAYIMPAFQFVSEEVSLHDIKHAKYNAFYKEYVQGIHLARLILKRFGYNINNTQQTKITTPPFWIDMSKLFELYVLGLLKETFGSEVEYQFQTNYGKLDYLLIKQQIIVDAKYKTYYCNNFKYRYLSEYQ